MPNDGDEEKELQYFKHVFGDRPPHYTVLMRISQTDKIGVPFTVRLLEEDDFVLIEKHLGTLPSQEEKEGWFARDVVALSLISIGERALPSDPDPKKNLALRAKVVVKFNRALRVRLNEFYTSLELTELEALEMTLDPKKFSGEDIGPSSEPEDTGEKPDFLTLPSSD